MAAAGATGGADPMKRVSALVEAGSVDTVYRDVYLDRARALLTGVLPLEDFRSGQQREVDLAALPLAIARAVEKADWAQVKDLSERSQALREAVEGQRGLIETARGVYAVTDVKLDPFSPGLTQFTGVPASTLPGVRDRAVERLAGLEESDRPWQAFYAQRRDALRTLTLGTAEQRTAASGAAAADNLREAAVQALKSGDMGGLAKLAATLMASATPRASETKGPTRASGPASGSAPETPTGDFLVPFSGETLAGAKRLGLAARRLESRVDIAYLRQYAWNPMFADESGRIAVKDVPLPAGAPEASRQRLEISMIHPLVNSGGARHVPKFLAEDLLVEDFPDPTQGEVLPASDLLSALRLPARRGLPRTAIEQALLAHGNRLVQDELYLDPRAFRLVCIPPDVHLRLGEAEGWGQQDYWTHFDGYLVMADGRLRALAGGDARFGGLYDLLGISRDYDSEQVMARFAVVRRERMVEW